MMARIDKAIEISKLSEGGNMIYSIIEIETSFIRTKLKIKSMFLSMEVNQQFKKEKHYRFLFQRVL